MADFAEESAGAIGGYRKTSDEPHAPRRFLFVATKSESPEQTASVPAIAEAQNVSQPWLRESTNHATNAHAENVPSPPEYAGPCLGGFGVGLSRTHQQELRFRWRLYRRPTTFQDQKSDAASTTIATETDLPTASGIHSSLDARSTRHRSGTNAFLRACAKVGIIALVDEATGYQAQRPLDELQLKLRLFLAEEMRKREKTFPDELWIQFGRLTNWKGTLHQRPKYWGKLVMKLIYEYLDPDVAQWLRENAPKPIHGKNYFQWLNDQYGLKKLIEHIWKVVGIASTCATLDELESRMEELYGKRPGFQFQLKLASPVTKQ